MSGVVLGRRPLFEALGQQLPRVVALIGGGGKTTLLYGLGDWLARQGERVLLTTTTHLGYDPAVVSPDSPAELNRALAPGRAVLAGRPDGAGHKLTGIPADWYGVLEADHILVEADGSRGLPLKYHRPFEPVVPPGTGLLIELAGLTALGRPVGETVHGWQASGVDREQIVEEACIAALLERGMKASRFTGNRLALLNQADTQALARRGARIAGLLRQRGIDACVTRMEERERC